MKRRIASAMLLVVLIALLAGNVSAAESYVCQDCGKSYADCNWQPWTITNGGTETTLAADGHYYLTGDVTNITSQLRIGDGTNGVNITIDLRGYTMSSTKRVFGVYANSTLSIVDSVGGGVIQGKQTATSQVGGTIRVNKNATLNLYGGTVKDAATADHAAYGGVIATEDGSCTINIAGGSVIGNAFAPYGGAIYAAKNSVVNISAGSVTGSSAWQGGAIYLNKSTLNVTGGTIYGGTATTTNAAEGAEAGYGGAVYGYNGSQITVNGGAIYGGTAYHGGAIALMSSQLDVQSGSIYGGSVNGYGSAVHLLADTLNETAPVPCTVNITGGTVTGQQDSGKAAITIASHAHELNMSGGTITGAGKPGAGGSAISGQGTIATINLTGGTITGAASMSTNRSGVVYSRGFLNVSEANIEVTAGDGPAVYMYQTNCLLTVTGSALETLPGRVRLVDSPNVSGGSGSYKVVDGITDGIWYYKGAEAVKATGSDGFVRSYGGGILNMQGKTVAVDVNGQKLTLRNGTFYGFDSKNDSYNPEKCGKVTVESTAIQAASSFTAPTGRTYVAVNDGTNLTFHRVNLELPSVTLRTSEGKEGIYFNATLRADSDAISALKTYGVALTLTSLADEDWAAAVDGIVKRSTYSVSSLSGAKTNNINSTSLVKILRLSNSTQDNISNANTRVWARPYLQLTDGSFLFGNTGSTCMRDVAQVADTQWSSLTDVQKQGLLGMYERFPNAVSSWQMGNLVTAYKSGDAAINALILDYRRDRVLKAMQAQLDVLWTVDKQVTYSKVASSKGVDADLAKYKEAQAAAGKTYNPLDDQIITLYPDRIYQGLPYTHASSSIDAMTAFSVVDSNGVLNIQNANGSMFSGGSTNGSAVDATTGERTGQYNVARIGNDCWDMVHWSWGLISDSVTANETRGLTPTYGVVWLGQDLYEETLRKNKYVTADGYDMTAADSNLVDCICTRTKSGYALFKNILETDDAGNAIANNDVDGTRILRIGTRTKNSDGTYDYQVIYQTYAMMQPGDGMVRWRNGGGHAMMATKINVVYNSNGTINGDKSTISVLEQGSGHEERQSRKVSEFDTAVTAKHSSHTSANKSCMYCAGYTDTVIGGKHVWKMDACEEQVRTFREIAETDFMAFTCPELRDASISPSARVTANGTTNAVTGMLSGKLYTSYRLSYVELVVTDANGEEYSTACIGMQNSVSSPLDLSRFFTDSTAGVNGESVLTSKLPFVKDADGNITADTAILKAGDYTFRYVCKLNSGHEFTMTQGDFTVAADGTIS